MPWALIRALATYLAISAGRFATHPSAIFAKRCETRPEIGYRHGGRHPGGEHARFLREDWTACTDIGRPTPRGTLDKQEYLRVEGLYVDAVAALARAVEPDLLQVHDVEFWDTASDSLANLGLADVLDGSAAPAEGEPVAGARLDNVVRRCLREVTWLELMVAPKLLVHFGYDMQLIVASSTPLAGPLEQIRSSGLFVYDSDAPLPTTEAWGHS